MNSPPSEKHRVIDTCKNRLSLGFFNFLLCVRYSGQKNIDDKLAQLFIIIYLLTF